MKTIKFFLDTANIEEIQKWEPTGLIDGVTTNPSHMSVAGSSPRQVIEKICTLLPYGHISVEVTQEDPDQVYRQAHAISKIADNVIVKIPCHTPYIPIIKRLTQEGVRLNITLVFTLMQAMCMAKLGVMYVSPFVGRWDDIDVDGTVLLEEMRHAFNHYGCSTQILAASLRHVPHVHAAIMAGADALTMPSSVLQKALEHPLTKNGMNIFAADWKKLGITQFP